MPVYSRTCEFEYRQAKLGKSSKSDTVKSLIERVRRRSIDAKNKVSSISKHAIYQWREHLMSSATIQFGYHYATTFFLGRATGINSLVLMDVLLTTLLLCTFDVRSGETYGNWRYFINS